MYPLLPQPTLPLAHHTPSTFLPLDPCVCGCLYQGHRSLLFTGWIFFQLHCPPTLPREVLLNHVTQNSLPTPATIISFLMLVMNAITVRPVFALLFLNLPRSADLGLGHVTCFG